MNLHIVPCPCGGNEKARRRARRSRVSTGTAPASCTTLRTFLAGRLARRTGLPFAVVLAHVELAGLGMEG